MQLADVRVILADIPVRRPHAMSFTTLKAVNFAFVRLETTDGAVGWGEAACLGGPDVERRIGGVGGGHHRALHRPLAGGPRCHPDRGASPGDGAPPPGQSVRARRRGDGPVGPERPGPRGAGPPPARRARARSRAPVLVAGRGRSRGRSGRGARARGARASHLQDQDRGAPAPPRRGARAPDPRGGGTRRVPAGRRQSGLGPGRRAARHPRPGAVRSRLRGAAAAALGPGRHGAARAHA